MVARPGTQRTNFNAGELSVELFDRTDVKTWYAGAKLMDGLEPVPQGGWKQLPRSRHRARLGRAFAQIASQALSPVAGVTAAQVLATVDLGSAQMVAGIDLTGFLASLELRGAYITVDVSNSAGAPGPMMTGALSVLATARTRRLAYSPGGAVSGRYVHVNLALAPSASTDFTLGTISILSESFGLSCRLKPFGAARDRPYVVALSPGNAEIFRSGLYVASCPIPHTAAQLAEISTTQRFDTMLLWHPDVQPWRLLRTGGDSDWQSDPAPFENIPLADLGGTYTNAVAEVWNVYITWLELGFGFKFVLNIDGSETSEAELKTIGSAIDYAGSAADLKRVIELLPAIGAAGITVTAADAPVSGTKTVIYTVTFDGKVKGQGYSITGHPTSQADGAVTTSRVTKGVRAGEAIMSAARGYPRCGTFYQDRLVLGGFKALGSAYVMSGPGEYYNLQTLIEAPSAPILDNLDTDGSEVILQFVKSKQLVAFTDAANRFLTNRAITRSEPRNWSYSSNDGCRPGVPVIESESSLIFANESGTMLMAATYSDVSQGYDSQPISLLASQLLQKVDDLALQKSQEETDSQRLWIVNNNGTLRVGLLIRNQDVNAFVRWSTPGLVRSAAVDPDSLVCLAVQRQVAGVPWLIFETLEAGLLFDQAVTKVQAPSTTASGFDVLEGATVWADCDGYIEGPFTVASGSFTLPYAATTITAGRWTAPVFEDLPLSKVVNGDMTVLKRPCRVHTVRLELLETTSVAIGANGRPARDVALSRFGGPVDQPPAPYTGPVMASGLDGWSPDGSAVITQVRPGKLSLRSYVREAKT